MPRPKILLVDDDEKLRLLLEKFLSSNGFDVMSAAGGGRARQIVQRETIDALVLDVMMPGEDGFQLAQRLKIRGLEAPILFLTALGAPSDRIKGLELGAADYLPKPFEPQELLLRLRNILRRRPAGDNRGNIITFGPFTFDKKRQALKKGDALVPLTDLEKQLLFALAEHADQPLSREKLAQTNLGAISDRTVDVQVARLRRKVENDPKQPAFIKTIRHKGYVLVTQDF